MPITSRQLPTLLEGQKKILIASLQDAMKEAVYPKFIEDGGGTNKKSEAMQDYEPMGSLPIWPENTGLEELEMYEGWNLRISQVAYGGKVIVTKQMREFDQADLIESCTMQLGQSAEMTKDIILVAYVVYGDQAVSGIPKLRGIPIITPKTGDGQPLFSTAHKWRSNDSYTFANKAAAYVQPTYTGVFAIHKQVGRWKAPNGRPMMITLDQLMIPLELEQLVSENWNTPRMKGQPDTNNNAINTMREFLKNGYFVNKWLPSASNWLALTSARKGRVRIKWGWKNSVRKIPLDPHTETSGVATNFSFSHGCNIPLGYVLVAQ